MVDSLQVKIAQGALRGVAATPEVRGFFGIPYAAAPIGPLRWQPPQPAPGWPGIRAADGYGCDPVQPVGKRVSRAPGRAEDCLYLNVWAPQEQRAGGWPVLVWSCGGAFTTGGGAFVEEDPARLAARGAIVVSFNIRLGLFGFLAHPELSAESPHGSSGNYGLLDQAAAFAWVRENIAAFGGDAANITFFGESAGATAGMLLLASPIVSKPYDRAILQSPGSFGPLLSREEAERHGGTLGGSLAELRGLSTEALLDRAKALPPAAPGLWLARPLRPIVDGWLLVDGHPFTNGGFDAVPAIIGTNEDEGRFFAPRMGIDTIEDYHRFVRSIFGDNADQALARYPVSDQGDVPAMFSALFGDRAFSYPIDQLIRTYAAKQPETYRYMYGYRHGGADRPPTHAEETGVLMDNVPRLRPEDAEMADMMARQWIAFAERGSPNGPGLPPWPRYDLAARRHLTLDIPPSIGSDWRADEVAFIAAKAVD